ncbi:MAG: phosphatidylserine decarboxylase family protein [Candidatus Kapabacteria bacterium]|nr:phosphatidylserine decarboxylase family protein [Ignavibacteriota bacterium]MCW5885846.1 phosphatidylserine decarboxylase family protein [Candidatus Kapabacteria bacterium]
MLITKYGVDNFLAIIVISLLLIALGTFLPKSWFNYIPLSFGIILFIFAFVFFRDPERVIPTEVLENDKFILAPADGKVVEITDDIEKDYVQGEAIRISIFLSPLDVHVNRSPVSGKVEYYKYFPGEYLVAYHPKSSELNEHSKIGVITSSGKVAFKQIVGVLARRIVCDVNVNDNLKAGDKIGMMKFGSRMDIFVPKGTEFMSKVGDRVVAGETIMARMP